MLSAWPTETDDCRDRSRHILFLDNANRYANTTERLKTCWFNTVTESSLSATLFAIADPTRRGLLHTLSLGEATVGTLAEPYEMSLAAISKHLRVLERAGLISRGRNAQWRPCRLQAGPLKEVADWTGDFQQFWERNLDSLDGYLHDLQAAKAPK
jgi:DNA-binding transcriptional ArsR family regulator